jgi:hypothetical protein
MDQNCLGGELDQAGIGEHIYCVLYGHMTPDQKQIVCKRSKVDTHLFIAVLKWFVKESGHPGYTNTFIPEDCTQPLLVKDPKARNNTNDPTIVTVEADFEGRTYFSHPHKIHQRTHWHMVPLIDLLLQRLTALHQLYWHMVVLC